MKRYTILFLVLVLSSCGSFLSMPKNNSVSSIQIHGSETQNYSRALAVDAVFVYDENLATLLSELTAADWFAQKQGIFNSYPGLLEALHWEVAPYSQTNVQALPKHSKSAIYVAVFANYISSGIHRIEITDIATVNLLLGTSSATIQNTK